MKKFTLILSLMVAFATSAMADLTQYYYKNSNYWVNTDNYPNELNSVIENATVRGEGETAIKKDGATVQLASKSFTVVADGNVVVTFIHNGGDHMLNILGVDVVDANGVVVKSDYHYGSAGGTLYENAYTLEGLTAGANLTLRCFVYDNTATNDRTNSAQGYYTVSNVTALPELTTNAEAPVYYAIRNIRNGNYYVTYSRSNGQMLLNTAISNASIFYFTGSVENGVATVKIHNYAANGLCMNDFASWTAEGIDWYIQESGNTEKPGYAISKVNDLTNNAYSWNNAANTNTKIDSYNGNDVGSTFEFIKLSAEQVQNIANSFVSSPEKLTSGKSYNFRNLSALGFLAGGDNVGVNAKRDANTNFAYYVSPNTGAKYLYNVNSQKFIGTTSEGNANIPLVDTPVSLDLTFKKSDHPSFPIMISTNKGGGAVNYSGWFGRVLNWQGGFGDTGSADNSFCVEEVSLVDEATLATIEELVGTYELPIWKEQCLASLGCVGSYALDLRDEIEAVDSYEALVAFETANAKIAINTENYYRLVCVAPKKGNNGDVNYNTLAFNGETNLVTTPADASNINQVFKFEDAGNNYFYLKNLNANGYLNPIGVGDYRSTVVASTEEACKVNVVSLASGCYNMAQHRLQNQGTALCSLYAENKPEPEKGAAAYACSGWNENANSPSAWYIIPATEVEVTVNEFASICLPFAVEVEGATAYAVEDVEAAYVKLVEKADIPAGEGAILAGEGKATLSIVAEAETDWSNNKLEGTTVATYVAGNAYVLANGTEGIGLYAAALNKDAEGNEGTTHFKNNANKAYLPVADGASLTAAFYGFNWDGTTGVENVEVENEVKAIYDLTGRKVETISAPGIYIINGKKTLVK